MITKKLRRYFQNFHDNYLTASKQIAIAKNRNRTKVLSKMVACRLLFHHNATFYGLYNLDDRRFSEWSDYLTKEDMDKLQMQFNPEQHTGLADNKLLFYERCLTHQIPTPPILGVLPVGNLHIPMGIFEVLTEDQLSALIIKHQNKMVIFKTVDGSHGDGFLSLTLTNGKIFDHHGAQLTVHEVYKHCRDHGASFLIQPLLTPHPHLKPLMPGLALGTFRVVTIFDRRNHKVLIPYAFAKIPRQFNIIDNFKHGDTGNLLCQVEVETGKMMDAWGKPQGDPIICKLDQHPDTSLVFREFKVPCWEDVIALARRAAECFPELPTLGWDIAITDQGVMVLETNWHYDPDGMQITLNRGIKSEIKALYGSIQFPHAYEV